MMTRIGLSEWQKEEAGDMVREVKRMGHKMGKTKMMHRYERETGKMSMMLVSQISGVTPSFPTEDYIAWLESKANISDDAIGAFQEIIRTQCDEISALKEKAAAYDRVMSGEPKHCPFCHGEIKPIDQPPFWMAINGSQIDVYVDGLGAMATTINYCPMCGRRLTLPDGWE